MSIRPTTSRMNTPLQGGGGSRGASPSVGNVFQSLDSQLGSRLGGYQYRPFTLTGPLAGYVGKPVGAPDPLLWPSLRKLSAPMSTGAPAARTPASTPTSTPAPKHKPATYTVKSGDYLYKIAADVLGDANRWKEIASLNNISAPYTIQPGQVLKLPSSADKHQPPSAPETYTVKSGDYLYKIAADVLGDANRWKEIASLNDISEPYTIYSGQVLKLPAKTE